MLAELLIDRGDGRFVAFHLLQRALKRSSMSPRRLVMSARCSESCTICCCAKSPRCWAVDLFVLRREEFALGFARGFLRPFQFHLQFSLPRALFFHLPADGGKIVDDVIQAAR